MQLTGRLDLALLFRAFKGGIFITWLLVLLENIMLALIPLFIGRAIDGLQAGDFSSLISLGLVLLALTALVVLRRFYDTRAYGRIRVALGCEVDRRHEAEQVSTRNARLDMAREIVDFLEENVPSLITAIVQIGVALIILWQFDAMLAAAAIALVVGMALLYGLFHGCFYHLNSALNSQVERQVGTLESGGRKGLAAHLRMMNKWEIRLSDTEALVYGLIFLLTTGFIIFNLWFCASLPNMSAGKIFSVISYSWEYAEATFMLPVTLQSLTRLHEITSRLNSSQAQPQPSMLEQG
ncbi:ABC transporter six-transmembrane domain-containing protein [Spongorhabdus nitratireducens]